MLAESPSSSRPLASSTPPPLISGDDDGVVEAGAPTQPNSLKRSIRVISPEKESGGTEYKRQVYSPSPSRLRSLVTQMSYRLDEGMGRCTYHVGVEDDGCHSLLDYASVAESARVIECIARSLNAVVLERTMIQGEVVVLPASDSDPSKSPTLAGKKNGAVGRAAKASETAMATTPEGELRKVERGRGPIIRVNEPPVLGGDGTTEGGGRSYVEEKEEKSSGGEDDEEGDGGGEGGVGMIDAVGRRRHRSKPSLLSKDDGVFTRCVLTIQRVETHLLDPSPVSLTKLLSRKDRSESSVSDGIADSAEATMLLREAASASSPSSSSESQEYRQHSVSETLSRNNIRIAVVGNVDAGKSTLIGSLTTSCLDDGRGKCRTSIMKHRHEIESGRTSTATTHLMGFRHNGDPIAGRDQIRANKRKTEDEVARESYRVCTLIDLAGHEKYLKTTIHGVSSGMCDYGLILVNSRHPPTHMTQHHLNLCCSFGIPVIVVFTKVDGCPEHALKNSRSEVFKLLRAPDVGRKPFAIRSEKDISTCAGKLHTLAPVLETSCVTGEGMDLLRKVLFALPKRRRHENKSSRPFEFLVEDIFNVPGVGSVVSGFVNAGELTVGSNCHIYVGPTDDGSFLRTVAKSAHIARINTSTVTSGQSACLALALNKETRKKLRRGMVVLRESPSSTREFDAEICVLKGEGTTIRKSYQAYVHILNVRQSAYARRIEMVNNGAAATALGSQKRQQQLLLGRKKTAAAAIDDDGDEDGIVLRPGCRAKVRFEFAQRPEYIRPGMRMLFRDGRVRGVGIITAIPEVQSVV